MIRFWRWVLLFMGLCLFICTLVRAIQPRESQQLYQVIYGDVHGNICCATYLVNEEKRQANRVRIGLMQQEEAATNLSPSGKWKFANVLLSVNSNYRAYFIPVLGGEPMPLPSPIERSWYPHWSTHEDALYVFVREYSFESALYRITPADRTPVRMSEYIFGGIRAFQEQPLPTTHFTPWLLLLWSINVLFIAGGLRYWQTQK